MDEAFNKFQAEGKNTLDNILKWMKDSKIIDDIKSKEDEARKMFDSVKDKKSVQLDEFKNVLTQLAQSQKKPVEELFKKLTEELPNVLNSLKGAASNAVTAGVSAVQTNVQAALPGLGKK